MPVTSSIKCKLNPLIFNRDRVFIFSILFTVHLLGCCQGEFVYESRVSLVGDHFLYSHDINVWFSGDIVRRNARLLVTL